MLYDELAPFYPFLFEDWDASIARQATALDELIRERWGRPELPVLDVAAGIGTQAIGLAGLGYRLMCSDQSHRAIRRAGDESRRRLVRLACVVADFRSLPYRDGSAALVIAADNSLPHLLTDDALLGALRECFRCLCPGAGLLLTVRDYGPPPPTGTVEHHPYGWRRWGDWQYFVDQEWHWDGPCYDLRITASPTQGGPPAHVFTGRYYAIAISALRALCYQAGFIDVIRQDGRFYQPVLLATKAPVG